MQKNSRTSAPNFREVKCCCICKHRGEKHGFRDWNTIYSSCEKHKEFFRPHDDSDYEYDVTLSCMVYNVCDDFEE